MNRLAINCTELTSVGYNPRIFVLELEFVDGSIRTYFNVPNDVFEGLMSAESHSTFYEIYIKKQFKSRKAN